MKDPTRWVGLVAIAGLDVWIAAWLLAHGAPMMAAYVLVTGALVILISSLVARLE